MQGDRGEADVTMCQGRDAPRRRIIHHSVIAARSHRSSQPSQLAAIAAIAARSIPAEHFIYLN
jgi:hypothetical protein